MKENREKVYAASIEYGSLEIGCAFVKKRTDKRIYLEIPEDRRAGFDLTPFGYQRVIKADAGIAFDSMAEALQNAITKAKEKRKDLQDDLRCHEKAIAQAKEMLKKAKARKAG